MRWCINWGREGGKPVIFCNSISDHKRERNTTYSENEIPILITECKSKRFCSPQRKIHETESKPLHELQSHGFLDAKNFTKTLHNFSFTQATLKQIGLIAKLYLFIT
jgi:hypothetical protein